MGYARKTWADGESGGTPITAAELNRMEAGIDDLDRRGKTAIVSGAVCDIDYSTGAYVYTFTANQDFSISVSNLPASDAWGVVLMLTNAGAYTVTYPAAWMEAGGTVLSFTAAGTDRLVITGEGNDETTVIISVVSEDVK